MILVSFDPGSNMTGYANVTVTGGNGLPVRVRYVDAGNVPSKPSSLGPQW